MTNSVLVATNSVFLAAPPWTFPTVVRTNSPPPSSGIVKIEWTQFSNLLWSALSAVAAPSR